jgi:hypothetical protein
MPELNIRLSFEGKIQLDYLGLRELWRSLRAARRSAEHRRVSCFSCAGISDQRRISSSVRPQPMQTSSSSRQQMLTQGEATKSFILVNRCNG